MQIQCECGKFRAELTQLPKNTVGRSICYCDDCQAYLHHLGRADLLDSAGGTEIIPVYPSEYKIISGKEFLTCTMLSPKGMHRWSTTCCNTPVGNTRPKFPWVGVIHRAFTVNDANSLEKTLGPIKSRIQGKFAKGIPPQGTSNKFTFKDFRAVIPFILKGFLTGKVKGSPFFETDGLTPIAKPKILSER